MQTRLSSGVTALQAGVLIARRLNPVAFPPLARLAAHVTSVKGFQLSVSDALPYGVRPVIYIDTKSAELLFDLQDFERASSCFLGFRNERFQAFAHPPHDIEPAVAMGKFIPQPVTLNHDGQCCINFCSSSFFMFVHSRVDASTRTPQDCRVSILALLWLGLPATSSLPRPIADYHAFLRFGCLLPSSVAGSKGIKKAGQVLPVQ